MSKTLPNTGTHLEGGLIVHIEEETREHRVLERVVQSVRSDHLVWKWKGVRNEK